MKRFNMNVLIKMLLLFQIMIAFASPEKRKKEGKEKGIDTFAQPSTKTKVVGQGSGQGPVSPSKTKVDGHSHHEKDSKHSSGKTTEAHTKTTVHKTKVTRKKDEDRQTLEKEANYGGGGYGGYGYGGGGYGGGGYGYGGGYGGGQCPYRCMSTIIHARRCHSHYYKKCSSYYGWCSGGGGGYHRRERRNLKKRDLEAEISEGKTLVKEAYGGGYGYGYNTCPLRCIKTTIHAKRCLHHYPSCNIYFGWCGYGGGYGGGGYGGGGYGGGGYGGGGYGGGGYGGGYGYGGDVGGGYGGLGGYAGGGGYGEGYGGYGRYGADIHGGGYFTVSYHDYPSSYNDYEEPCSDDHSSSYSSSSDSYSDDNSHSSRRHRKRVPNEDIIDESKDDSKGSTFFNLLNIADEISDEASIPTTNQPSFGTRPLSINMKGFPDGNFKTVEDNDNE